MSEEVLYLFSTYDIRSSANACKTLVGLSGVDISTWEQFVGHESEYRYTDDLVEDVIKRFGHLPRTYLDFNFVYFHVTTSANECEAIKKYGMSVFCLEIKSCSSLIRFMASSRWWLSTSDCSFCSLSLRISSAMAS